MVGGEEEDKLGRKRWRGRSRGDDSVVPRNRGLRSDVQMDLICERKLNNMLELEGEGEGEGEGKGKEASPTIYMHYQEDSRSRADRAE